MRKSLAKWIKDNRDEIDDYIHGVVPERKLCDDERKLWALNADELTMWAAEENVNI